MHRKIRIGIDTRDLRTSISGQKTYLEELLQALQAINDQRIEILYFAPRLPTLEGKNTFLRLLEHGRLHIWKQLILPIKALTNKCDILFTTDYFVPYFHPRCKTVTVFHDAFFFENPEHYSPTFLWFFKRVAIPSARKCSAIVAPTRHAAFKIAHYFCLPKEQIHVIGEGPKSLPDLSEHLLLETLKKFNLHEEEYILHVGMMNKRKNIPGLIKAFQLVKDKYPKLKLVLAGSSHTTRHISDAEQIEQTIEQSGVKESIIVTGYLTDDEINALYTKASLYIFPSFNEGFGLPLLEAFQKKIPAAVSNNSCLTEVGGDAVVSFNPYQHEEIAQAILMVIEHPSLRKQLIRAGKERLANYSWQKSAESFINLWLEIA